MTVYIDNDYKCYTEPADGLTAVETSFFDGKCMTFIEGYRYIPEGCEWKRKDGVVFTGEMASPWEDYSVLAAAQAWYEIEDMRAALELLGVKEENNG